MRTLCRALEVHPGGYYAWVQQPLSDREIEGNQLTGDIKQYWLESGGHSGYRNIHQDLLEAKIVCGRDRVLRLMRLAGLRAQRGYKAPKGYYGGTVHPAAPNILNRQFEVNEPNQWWVSDITYIHTHEGFLFLAVAMDLFARNIVGWSMSPRVTEDLVLDALTMAYWRRKPTDKVMLHSDQGSQYTSNRCKKLLKTLNMEASMSRRGNCHDNAVAESFFANLKKEKSGELNTKPVQMHAMLCLTISKCFITPYADIRIMTEWRQRFMNSDILRIRKVSRKLRLYQIKGKKCQRVMKFRGWFIP
ncbi:MAG: putative transposase [Porticoccaceae bacterium]